MCIQNLHRENYFCVNMSFIFEIYSKINSNFATRIMQRTCIKMQLKGIDPMHRVTRITLSFAVSILKFLVEKNLICDATTSLYQQSLKTHISFYFGIFET